MSAADDDVIKVFINVPTEKSFSTDLLFPCGIPSGGTVSLIVGDSAQLKQSLNCESSPPPFGVHQRLIINSPNCGGKPLCIPKSNHPKDVEESQQDSEGRGGGEDDGQQLTMTKKVRADTLLSDLSSEESESSECVTPAPADACSYVCGLCDQTFVEKSVCQDHVWSHMPPLEKVYECRRCEATLSTAFALDRHNKSCEAEKVRHPCATCDALFDTPRELEKHSWLHNSQMTVYCCEYCDWQFMLKVHYDLHLVHNHKDEELSTRGATAHYTCTLCSLTFDSEEERENHKASKHQVELVTRNGRHFYVCPICRKHISASFHVFNKHMAVHRNPERTAQFCCSQCGTWLLTLGGYRHHMAMHKETKAHSCEQCTRTFRTSFYLRKHVETVHATELKYPCRFCPRKFVNEQKLKLHLALLHEELLNDDERLLISSLKVYPCDHCPFSTYSQKVIKNHISGHTGDYAFHCSHCQKGYSYKYQLTQHMAMSHMAEGGKCLDCGRIFYNDVSFERHKQVHLNNLGFPCPHCSKVYESEGLRRRHVTDNHGGVPGSHPCNVCGKCFALATSLRLHKRSAHESRKAKRPGQRFSTGHVCDVCGMDFKFVGSLHAHKVVRHETGPGQDIVCPYCEKKSSSQLTLSLHMRIHFNEKPFKCKYCPKEFTLHTSCKSHQRTHERSNQPLVCPHCDRTFFIESKLKRHLMAFHDALYDDKVAVTLGYVHVGELDEPSRSPANAACDVESSLQELNG